MKWYIESTQINAMVLTCPLQRVYLVIRGLCKHPGWRIHGRITFILSRGDRIHRRGQRFVYIRNPKCKKYYHIGLYPPSSRRSVFYLSVFNLIIVNLEDFCRFKQLFHWTTPAFLFESSSVMTMHTNASWEVKRRWQFSVFCTEYPKLLLYTITLGHGSWTSAL